MVQRSRAPLWDGGEGWGARTAVWQLIEKYWSLHQAACWRALDIRASRFGWRGSVLGQTAHARCLAAWPDAESTRSYLPSLGCRRLRSAASSPSWTSPLFGAPASASGRAPVAISGLLPCPPSQCLRPERPVQLPATLVAGDIVPPDMALPAQPQCRPALVPFGRIERARHQSQRRPAEACIVALRSIAHVLHSPWPPWKPNGAKPTSLTITGAAGYPLPRLSSLSSNNSGVHRAPCRSPQRLDS